MSEAPADRGRSRRLADPDLQVSLVAAGLALVLYLLVGATYPVEWDGAQLVLALDRFDVANGTPHPPGYWLYVVAGRAVRGLTWLDGPAALTFVAAVAAAATVGVTNAVGRAMGGRLLGVVAAGLVATSPFLWFYGASVDTYTLDALACIVLLSLAWHARRGSVHGLAAAGVLGLSAGFRQTSLLLFAPLAVVAMARSARSLRTWVAGGLVGTGAVAAWLVPMLLEQPGGLRAWREASDALLEGSVAQTALWSGTREVVTRNMTQGGTYLAVALLPAAVVGVVALLAGRRRRWAAGGALLAGRGGRRWSDRDDAVEPGADDPAPASAPTPWHRTPAALAALAAVPAVAFLVLVHFGKAGYVLAALPAAVLLLCAPVAGLGGRAGRLTAMVALVVCLVSVERFVLAPGIVPEALVDETALPLTSSVNGAPFRFTASAIAESDRLTTSYLALGEAFDPERDVLVWGWLNGGERYRHATLTLPGFTNSFVRDSVHVHTARGGRWRTDPDTTLEVPAGGRAVFALDHVSPDLQALLDAGTARAVRLPTGPTVWVVRPGVTLLGVRVVVGDTRIPSPPALRDVAPGSLPTGREDPAALRRRRGRR